MTQINLDKEELRGFVELMHQTARRMRLIRETESAGYAQSDDSPNAAYRNGVKLTIGSVDYMHPGRMAGEIIADRIAETLEFVQSVEEGAQAMGDFVEYVLTTLGEKDEIAAEQLAELGDTFLRPNIMASMPTEPTTEGV